jgi:hypothetical protein
MLRETLEPGRFGQVGPVFELGSSYNCAETGWFPCIRRRPGNLVIGEE